MLNPPPHAPSSAPLVEFQVEGMTCTNCSLAIVRHLEKQGMEQVKADFTTGEVSVLNTAPSVYDRAKKSIEYLGYTVVADSASNEVSFSEQTAPATNSSAFASFARSWHVGHWFVVCSLFTLPLLLSMLPFAGFQVFHHWVVQAICSSIVYFIGLWHFGRSALGSLRAGVANMYVLVLLGASMSMVYSYLACLGIADAAPHYYFETAAVIITLVLLGNYLEHRAITSATSAISDLSKLQRTKAKRIKTNAQGTEYTEEIDAHLLQIDDQLLVNEGDRIAADGLMLKGTGYADESMISGESLPVEKMEGSSLIGGTVLSKGSIEMRVTAVGKQTALSQIIQLVKNAQADKPDIQRLADRVSAVFVPAILGIALFVFIFAHYFLALPWADALMRAVAVLVVSCPCAMGLATPTAMIVAIGNAAKNGMLIKGAATLEELAKLKQIAFDKTGTLSTGSFALQSITVFDEKISLTKVKNLIYGIEQRSSHPIAASLLKQLQGQASPFPFKHIEEIKGRGMKAIDFKGNQYLLGSHNLVAHQLPDKDPHTLYLLQNDQLLAGIDIEDQLRPDAKSAVQQLQTLGIDVLLLSGDRKSKCLATAQQVGIPPEKVFAEKMPSEKMEIIASLAEKQPIAMTGDGINDAPALTKANIGISLANATQIAMQAAQVILLNNTLSALPRAVQISRQTIRVVQQNLFWAFFYNLLMIPFAAAGAITPGMASAAMSASSIIVVLNSLRLRKA